MAISDCTSADELQAAYPCTRCLSENELWVVLVQALATQQGVSVSDLEAAAVKYRNISEVNFLKSLIGALPSGVPDIGPDGIDQCLACYGKQELKGMFIYLWCNLVNP